MPTHISINDISMADGTNISLPKGGILIFVGPNNSGKSTALRELNSRLFQGNTAQGSDITYNVVTSANARKEGSDTDFVDWLNAHGRLLEEGRNIPQGHMSESRARSQWQQPTLGEIWGATTYFGTATQRVQQLTTSQYDPRATKPTAPLQILWGRKQLEADLSKVMQAAFQLPLSLNRIGQNLRLYIKQLPKLRSDIPTDEYLDALETYPNLDEQGDGMRSFVEVLLRLKVQHNFCVFVDEPEAFLHPPQAILLGEQLKIASNSDTQVIIATHSSDILKGILSTGGNSQVTIVRLTRENNSFQSKHILPSDVSVLWADSSLQYSNLLDGIFNNAVILCEAGVDCRFYSAILDNLPKSNNRYSNAELLFAPVGGKHAIRKVANIFRRLGVPTRAIVDLDLLNDQTLFRQTFESLGGNWSAVSADYEIVKNYVNSLPGALEGTDIKSKLQRLIAAMPDTALDRSHVKQLNEVTRGFTTSWGRLKAQGSGLFPSGATSEAFQRLLNATGKVGLFLVEKGEMENFIKNKDVNGKHGEKWLSTVLEKGYHISAAHGNAGLFIKKVTSRTL